MRSLALLLVASTLAACSTTAEPPTRTAEAQAKLQNLLAGKTPGTPVSCLPPGYRSSNMVIIDDDTIAFRDGSRRVYVNNLRGGCGNLGSGFYSLVTRTSSASGPCSGDIAQVMDLRNGFSVGGCAFGEFVPYTKAG